ncbi:uncharacterized protein LOC143735152 [Siphateles boraxobius]|uniref:uncharacterized protein LOC143735152 n=1 Tax=Siphateles boraxobius TaxID=180520 RepID=UPI004063E330
MLEPQYHQTQLITSMKNLVIIFLFSLVVNDVSGAETDVVESLSVIEGDSFTLHTDVTEIPDGAIVWSFGDVVIARISSESNENKVYFNDKFNDTMKPDNQTGDLKIRKVRITDFGLYTLEINSDRGISYKTFNVSGVNNLVSDGVKLVPVLERDSVILSPGLTEIQRDDQITWTFNGTVIGQLKIQTAEIFADVLDGRFEDRLQLNQQNGSLIITNVRPNTSGPYEVDIKSGISYTTHKTFRVTIIDEGNRLSVMEGTSVTLESGVSKIHRDDVIIWRCEYGDSVIAKMSYGIFATFDGADGRFRGKLKLDYKTGSLTISDTRTKHTGLYHLDITSNRSTTFRRFNISVCSQDWSPFIIAVMGVAVLLLVVVVVTCCRKRVSRLTKFDNWRNPEHQLQCEKGEEETDIMFTRDITPRKGKVTQISFRELHQEHSYTAHCLSQSFSTNINHMIYPSLTEMEDQFGGTRRRHLKNVM